MHPGDVLIHPWLITGQRLAGADEAGRGPLVGPVVAAAVILDPRRPINGLTDSKRLTPQRRLALAREIEHHALAFAVASASVAEIDRLNILRASLLAMQRALSALRPAPQCVLVDGNQVPAVSWPVQSVVGGDASVPAISAASILAKVARDQELERLDGLFPGYGLARHKGYPTREHLEALRRLGPTPEHRRSFRPVRAVIDSRALDVKLNEAAC